MKKKFMVVSVDADRRQMWYYGTYDFEMAIEVANERSHCGAFQESNYFASVIPAECAEEMGVKNLPGRF